MDAPKSLSVHCRINDNIPGVTSSEGRGEVQTGETDESKNRQASEGAREREVLENGLDTAHEMLEEVIQPDPTEEL